MSHLAVTLLDLRGLKCPMPVLKTRAALRRMAAGAVLEVSTSDPMAAIDVPNLLRQTGDVLLVQAKMDYGMLFRIEKSRSGQQA